MKTKVSVSVLSLALIFSLGMNLPHALGAPGFLDPSFNGTGLSRFGFGLGPDYAHAVAAQQDGKLLMAGASENLNGQYQFSLVRFGTNNVLDPAFGFYGEVVTPVDGQINAMQIRGNGEIIVGGYIYLTNNYAVFALAEYTTNGALDTTFGTNGTGMVITDFGQSSLINALAIQGDGKIVAVGNLADQASFALARYETNGTLDASFGDGGTVTNTSPPGYAVFFVGNGVVLEADGDILVAGSGIAPGGNSPDFALFSYTTNGVLDTTFGGGTGKVFTAINSSDTDYGDVANAVAIQEGNNTVENPGKIVVAGNHADYSAGRFYVGIVRYNLNGTLDTTFGTGGIVSTSIGSTSDNGVGLAVTGGFFFQPIKFTIGGWGKNGFEMARFTAAGALDTTFGNGGTVAYSFGAGVDAEVTGMADQEGDWVLGGFEGVSGGNYDFAAVHFTMSGTVDTNFGNGGAVTADIANLACSAAATAIQANGNIVVAGSANNTSNMSFALARYNTDGTFDTTFGSNGKVLTVVGTNYADASAVAIQSDGRIVAAGTANRGFAVVRYNTNGTLDTSFGSGGQVFGFPGGTTTGMAIQPDGKIILVGNANSQYALARFTTNGAPDTSFGGSGTVSTTIGNGGDAPQAIGIQADGKIVAAGYSGVYSGTPTYDISLARYNTNGSLDFSFGSFGKVTTDFGSGNGAEGFALAIQSDGRLIVGGAALIPLSSDGNQYFTLVRYLTNGTVDTSFGTGGMVVTQVEFDQSAISSLVLQADGKIVAAGSTLIGTNDQYAVARYNTDGSLDSAYGSGGLSIFNFNDGGSDTGANVALDSIGRAVMAGNANTLFGVARLLGDAILNPSLNISLAGPNAVMVSWPASYTGWILQQNTGLASGNWTTSGYSITTSAGTNSVMVPPSAGNLFFRLNNP